MEWQPGDKQSTPKRSASVLSRDSGMRFGTHASEEHKLQTNGMSTTARLGGDTGAGLAPARQALQRRLQHPHGRPPTGTHGGTVGKSQLGEQSQTVLLNTSRIAEYSKLVAFANSRAEQLKAG